MKGRAKRDYVQITDQHFEVGSGAPDGKAAQVAVQQPAADAGNGSRTPPASANGTWFAW